MPPITKISGDLSRSRPPPTGTVTFLFTDIEGSTRRWESHRPEMMAALARHDALLEAAIESHGGAVFKKVGDEFCAVFNRATDAVNAAVDAQRVFQQEDFRGVGGLAVRMAVHTGEAEERDGDYFGPPLNRLARMLKLAHGEQIILSSISAELIGRTPDPGISLLDLGLHRVEGVDEPQHIFQLCVPGLRTDFPPTLAPAYSTNLPQQLASLIGRDAEMSDLSGLLSAERVITIAGAGGLGKTRLALELGAKTLDRFSDGVWFVELAPVSVGDFVGSAIATAINVHESQDRSVTQSLVQALYHKNILLIVDNCEHVIDAAAKIIDTLVRACPNVRVLVTSRQPLGISGEAVYRLNNLAFPKTTRDLNAQSAIKYSAIVLFVERARAADNRYCLTDETAPIVGEICRRLDGIPLAIELAAARVNVLSVAHLNDRLNERFRILTSGRRTELPRHQTMRALIDWSYNLLDDREKTLLRRMAIFAGGFSLEAASAVCAGEDLDAGDVFYVMASLVEKSLLTIDTGQPTERYALLETTREFALEALANNAETEAAARNHARYYSTLAEEADMQFFTTPPAAWFGRLKLEYENFHAALLWSLTGARDIALGGALAGSLERFWFDGGHVAGGLDWVTRALHLVDVAIAPQVVARLYLTRAVLVYGSSKLEFAERARDLYLQLGMDRGLGHALRQCALAIRHQQRWDDAEGAARGACQALERAGDAGGLAVALNTLGAIRGDRGDLAEARALHERGLAIAREARADYAVMQSYLHLGDFEFQCGNFQRAVEYANEALLQSEPGQVMRLTANLRCNRASYRIALNRLDEAADDAYAALLILQDVQSHSLIAIAVQHLALLAAISGDYRRAARWTGYVDAFFSSSGVGREATETWGRSKLEQTLRDKLSQDELLEASAEGGKLKEPQILEEIFSLKGESA